MILDLSPLVKSASMSRIWRVVRSLILDDQVQRKKVLATYRGEIKPGRILTTET
jgi:hypothetical protein